MIRKLVVLVAGLILIASQACAFSDMTEKDMYYDEISYLCNHNVFTGYSAGDFLPDNYVTRAELSVVMCRIMNIQPEDSSTNYRDVTEKHWANGYIAAVTKRGIIASEKDTYFRPDDKVTAELALMSIIDMTKQLESISADIHQFTLVYTEKATELGIEFPSEINKHITRRELARMIYSSLDVPIFKAYKGKRSGTIRENIQPAYKFKDKAIEYLCSLELGKSPQDIKPADMKNVKTIDAYNLPDGMYVETIEDVVNMPCLESIILTSQKVKDISPLSRIKGDDGNYIKEFYEIDIYDNPVKDISCLKGIKTENPISFPYERNDNEDVLLSVSEYCDMMDKVLSVTEDKRYDGACVETKLQAAHDEIILNCTYLNDGSEIIRTAYGTIVNGQALCEGYARAYKLFCDVLGVENYLAEGSAGTSEDDMGEHAWNEVVIDGEKKIVDVTWDDGFLKGPVYDYFLINSDVKTHKKRKYAEASKDRFSYTVRKDSDTMYVTVKFNTYDDAKNVMLKFMGSSEMIPMKKKGNGTWEYTYKENPDFYFDVRRVNVASKKNGGEALYSGAYRRGVSVIKEFDVRLYCECYYIEYQGN